MIPKKQITTILCAGPGLGFYVPGVIMERQLMNHGIPAFVHVFEYFLRDDKRANVPITKLKFHRNFSYALMGQNLAKDPSGYLNGQAIDELLLTWKNEGRKLFVVFSGFWIPILKRYKKECDHGNDVIINLCHIDADYSTSWKLFDTTGPEFESTWFNNWQKGEINFHLSVADLPSIPFKERKDSVVIHGGGWGMGTYKEKIGQLDELDFNLTVVGYEHNDLKSINPKHSYYLLDPDWNTWDLNEEGRHEFPPLISMDEPGKDGIYFKNSEFPPIYKVINDSKAIISKPGAGTLMDSLSSATPLVILEPFGEYERKNGLLWEKFGLGISYSDWEATGFDVKILENLHCNLLNMKSNTLNYIHSFIKFYHYGV